MRAIARRLQRLETRLAPQQDPRPWRIANLLYERRRRLAEAEGQPFKDLPPGRPGEVPTSPLPRRCVVGVSNLPGRPKSLLQLLARPELVPILPNNAAVRPKQGACRV